MPRLWASITMRTQSAADTFLGQIFARTESTRISADAPVIVSMPASLKASSARDVLTPDDLAA